MRFMHTPNTIEGVRLLPVKQKESNHRLLEVTLVVDVVHFVGTRLIEVSIVIQRGDSQAALLLSSGSFYQLWSRN